MEAARSGSVDAVRALVDRGADVNAPSATRQTALMWAVVAASIRRSSRCCWKTTPTCTRERACGR